MSNTSDSMPAAHAPAGPATAHGPLFSGFLPVFEGICHGVGVASAAFGLENQPRLQRVNAFRIDLNADGIDFIVTRSALVDTHENGPTIGTTVTRFMDAHPLVQIAVNANFTYCNSMEFEADVPYGIIGYLVSQEKVVCDPAEPGFGPNGKLSQADVPDETYAGAMAFVIQRGPDDLWHAQFVLATAKVDRDTEHDYVAVAGSPQPTGSGDNAPRSREPGPLMLVENGRTATTAHVTPPELVAARTAIGLDKSSRYMYLVTLDGLEHADSNAGFPQYGGGFHDIAEWMLVVGAHEALNLDGGGSAVAAMRTGVLHGSKPPNDFAPRLLNLPYGNESGGRGMPGMQRPLGCFLGVVAKPLTSH